MSEIDFSSASRALVVFDVCDTLYDTNTTVGFLRHVGLRSPKVAAALDRWTSRRSPAWFLGAAAHRLIGFDLARRRLVMALQGESRLSLEEAAVEYTRDTLPALANNALHHRLRQHQRAGHRVILISSSLDIVVARIADTLGVEFRASRLGFRGDSCSGRIETDLTGRKAPALRQLAGKEAAPIWVYTDNRSDRDILELAAKPIIVLPKRGDSQEWGERGYDYFRL